MPLKIDSFLSCRKVLKLLKTFIHKLRKIKVFLTLIRIMTKVIKTKFAFVNMNLFFDTQKEAKPFCKPRHVFASAHYYKLELTFECKY